jgi:hypothetical protein
MTRLCATNNGGLKAASGSIIFFLAILLIPAVAFCSPKKLVNDSEYKEKDFRKCNISDYSDMVDGDDIKWVWTDPAVKLAGYRIKEGKVENKSGMRSRSMLETVKNVFKDTFADMEAKGDKGTLTADICIFEAENFSGGKAWIPFVGGHEMQAGVGVEMVLRDARNRTVGKFRHSAREGAQIENAAQEVAGDLIKYIGDH